MDPGLLRFYSSSKRISSQRPGDSISSPFDRRTKRLETTVQLQTAPLMPPNAEIPPFPRYFLFFHTLFQGKACNGVQPMPVLFQGHGAQLLPFNLLDGLPAILVQADITYIHAADYSWASTGQNSLGNPRHYASSRACAQFVESLSPRRAFRMKLPGLRKNGQSGCRRFSKRMGATC
jgi:hypothetical protein